MRNQKIGFIFQGFNLIPDLNRQYRGMGAAERKQRIEEALSRVVSGGQQQRAAIARALWRARDDQDRARVAQAVRRPRQRRPQPAGTRLAVRIVCRAAARRRRPARRRRRLAAGAFFLIAPQSHCCVARVRPRRCWTTPQAHPPRHPRRRRGAGHRRERAPVVVLSRKLNDASQQRAAAPAGWSVRAAGACRSRDPRHRPGRGHALGAGRRPVAGLARLAHRPRPAGEIAMTPLPPVRPILSALGSHRAAVVLMALQIALTLAVLCNLVFIIARTYQRVQTPGVDAARSAPPSTC
ncbi:hypothetical protein NB693_21380 [Pantoea ananatis]|uniref:hypothetical protein n=1 Tax=Pantoea ananas TaxID=553 RepID=UPI0022209004|nr:hypothetical protein [Pantoea ananatis]